MDKLNDVTSIADKYFNVFLDYLPSLIMAIVIFLLGLWVIKIVVNYLRKLLEKRDYDKALRSFLLSIIDILLKIVLCIIVIAKLGIETTSFVAILGAAGLAVGLALQGSLANFAGGVMIILLKPFRVDDWISANGVSGTVKEITIFYTKLVNFNELLVVIPNSELSNNTITNYTVQGRRKDAITINLAYTADLQKTREVLLKLLNEQEGVYTDPAPQVVVGQLTQDSIDISVRFVASIEDFWRIHWYTLEHAPKRLAEAGIKLANPIYDVRLFKQKDKLE